MHVIFMAWREPFTHAIDSFKKGYYQQSLQSINEESVFILFFTRVLMLYRLFNKVVTSSSVY